MLIIVLAILRTSSRHRRSRRAGYSLQYCRWAWRTISLSTTLSDHVVETDQTGKLSLIRRQQGIVGADIADDGA